MNKAWLYATCPDGAHWMVQSLRAWGLSLLRGLRRVGEAPPHIGALLDRAHSRSGIFCQAAEALWLRSLGAHDPRPLLVTLRHLADAVVALTGIKAKVTGAIHQVDIDLGDLAADELACLGDVILLWRRITLEDGKPFSFRAPPPGEPHQRAARPPFDPRDAVSWIHACRIGDGARLLIEFDRATGVLAPPAAPKQDAATGAVDAGPRLTASQASAFSALIRLWESRSRPETVAGIRLRRHPLLIGPSGSGKSMLARELARAGGAAFFGTSPGSWIINGARYQPYTLTAIANRFRSSAAMVLFIDELEKLGTRRANTSDWSRCVYDEIFCLLDGRLDGIDGWDAALEHRARADMLIVCAATFQDLYRKKVGAPGEALFDQQWEEASIRDALATQEVLPEELLYRFGAALELSHPTAEEFRERVAALHAELGIGDDPESIASGLLRSGKGMRALEEYLTGLVIGGPGPGPSPG